MEFTKPFKPIELHTFNLTSDHSSYVIKGTVLLNPYEISSVEDDTKFYCGVTWEKFFPNSERCKLPAVGDSACIITMKTGKKYNIAEASSYITHIWEESMK